MACEIKDAIIISKDFKTIKSTASMKLRHRQTNMTKKLDSGRGMHKQTGKERKTKGTEGKQQHEKRKGIGGKNNGSETHKMDLQ